MILVNIYLRELKAYRKSFIIWAVATVFLVISAMSEYSASMESVGGYNEMLSKMPESIQKLLGVGSLDLSLAVHYYGVLIIYISLIASFHAIITGAGVISKEERDKTAEFLLTKPITRQRILTEKILASLTLVVLLNIVIMVSSFATVGAFAKNQNYVTDLIKLNLSMLVLSIIFMSLGCLSASVFSKAKQSQAVSSGIILTMFIMSIMVDMLPGTDFLRWFTIFQYFDAKDIINNNMCSAYVIISVVIFIASIAGTYINYKKRDINI